MLTRSDDNKGCRYVGSESRRITLRCTTLRRRDRLVLETLIEERCSEPGLVRLEAHQPIATINKLATIKRFDIVILLYSLNSVRADASLPAASRERVDSHPAFTDRKHHTYLVDGLEVQHEEVRSRVPVKNSEAIRAAAKI